MKRSLLAILFLLCVSTTAHAQLQPIPMQQSNAAEGSHLFAGTMLSSISVSWNTGTGARYLFLFDGALPANGSVTSCTTIQAAGCVLWCKYLTESTTAPNRAGEDFTTHPIAGKQAGITAALSTGAGCGTITVDTTGGFFYAQVR